MNTKQFIITMVLLFSSVVFGCLCIFIITNITTNRFSKELSATSTTSSTTLRLETVDGCEYVFYKNYGGITHHSACSNPIHLNQ